MTMFNNEAEKVIGMTAQELGTQMEHDKENVANILDKVHFKQFIFKCRAKIENYNVRCTKRFRNEITNKCFFSG